MVEALEQNVSAAAAAHQNDEDLLSGVETPSSSGIQKPTGTVALTSSNPAMDESYEETQMNPNGFFNECNDQAATVKVAVRIRPPVGRELRDANRRSCVESQPDYNKLTIGTTSFSYDRVFDQESYQEDIYEVCSRNLILGCFAGYNATILAYGQTGSGKTHTMGTGSTVGLPVEQIGIVPRVFDFIFEEIENRRKQSEFSEFNVKVQFLELYGDEIRDLLDSVSVDKTTGTSTKTLKITEAKNGSISVTGLKAELVNSKAECVSLLNKGIAKRMTAQTQMNEASSRSHAIFTVTIDQKIVKVTQPADSEPQPADAEPVTSEENISAKFHFVDLAGSERIKKTGATGKTLQEGIQINQGLLALGNVIAALTDEKKIAAGKAFIPYRNSKLTRILQDSLGGNSRTTMIACVSPVESNYEETLSTIKYASRARNIKNKPVVNRDANSMLIEALRNQITTLQTEIGEYQALLKQNNIAIPDELKEVVEAKAQETSMNRRSSVLNTQGVIGGVIQSTGPSQGGAQANVSTSELRDLKLKLARSEKENRELREQIAEFKKSGASSASNFDELQNERDQLIMKNEALNELLAKNNITMPTAVTQAHTTGGKRTQTVIDEYKMKMQKAQEESKQKTAEILQKSKKITELQSAIKRDEALLKSKIAEAEKYKKIVASQKPQERLIVQPVAMPGVKASRGQPKTGEQQVPDAEEIKNQFMDKLTSQLENFFADGEGAQPGADAQQNSMIDTTAGVADESTDASQVQEGDHAIAEQAHAEASRATSLEEKEKLLSAVKQNVDQIKSDLGELLKNTWAQRIQEIQTQMSKMEQDKRKTISAVGGENSAQTKAIEKEYKQKMEVLQNQLNEQQRQKKKKEDNIQKTMMQQESRLKAMELQLAQFKKQRDEAVVQQKYGEERFSKFKSNVNKDLITYKKTVKDKDQAVYKLKTDLKKTDQLVSQKIQELKSLQKKAREENEKRRKEEESEQNAKGIDIDAIKDWIHQSTDQLLKQQELNEYLKKQADQREEIEDDMLKEGDRLTDLLLQKERLEFEMESNANAAENGDEFDETRQLEIEAELEDVCLESDSITATLDVLEEHLDHVENKISQIKSEIKAFDMEQVQPPRFKGLNNVDNARATLKTFFMVLLDLNVYKKDLENKLIEQDEVVLDLQSKVNILQETSSLSSVQQQAALRKQQAMRSLVGALGEGTEFMDNRASAEMHLSTQDQTQLTKMSLSKIVSNLRNKLKEEEKRNQSVSNKLDQIIKEKEQIKQKYQQLQKELKMRGVSLGKEMSGGSFASTAYEPPARSTSSGSAPKALSKVTSRINTGLSAGGSVSGGQQAEPFVGHQSRSTAASRRSNVAIERPKKMSFKQRRDQAKQESSGKSDLSATQEVVDSLSRRPGVVKSKTPISNLQETRNKVKMSGNESENQALTASIDDLENEVKTNLASGAQKSSSKKRQYLLASQQAVKPKATPDEQYLNAPSQPETVLEDPDLEVSDQDEDQLLIEESDDVLENNLNKAEARLQQLEADEENKAGDSLLGIEQPHRFGNVSLLGESILQNETPDDYNWEFEDVADLAECGPDQKIVDLDSVNERCFILFSDLRLTEINLQTKMVVQEINVASLDGAAEHLTEPTGQKALAFAMFKELNMIAVSTAQGFHMFDYESEQLQHVKTLQLRNVRQICFVEMYIVLVVDDADDSGSDGEALLLCYMIDSDEPEGQIKIKEFLGSQVIVDPSEQSVVFATGSQIGRIQVPEMELMFQEDTGHNIIDFATNDTCIYTTGEDSSLRLFDVDQGMMLIEPMDDMEVDRLAVQGRHIVARCGGGQAMMVFKYTDGSEELEEEDFIECENLFGDGDSADGSKFLMKGGLKVALSDTEYNVLLTCYQDAQGKLGIKMLKNKSYGGV